ncbi:MAG: response regulator [Paenibacillaceae bacterium]|jgi:two-component system response regulator YesN|nr:response regulator [Paenibacillaceae bacterium]
MRILLAEDEPMFRKGLAKMIAGLGTGWEVCGEAENGEEAERLVEQLRPDLIITDIRMPLMDGLELLERVKAAHPDIAVIVITGYQDFHYAQSALRSGALDLLVKPCSKQDICLVLEKAGAVVAKKHEERCRESRQRTQRQENALRELFLRLPCSPETAAALQREICGSKLILLHIADYFPAHKEYLKKDMPLLQFAVLNITGELAEVHGAMGFLLIIETGRFALFVKEIEGEQELLLRGAIAGNLWNYLGLRVELHEAVAISSLEQLPDRYEELLAARRNGEGAPGAPSWEASREGLPLPDGTISRVKQQLLAAQLASLLQSGETEEIKGFLAQLTEAVCASGRDEWKMEALSLAFALRETARRHLEAEHDPRSVTARLGQLHECRGIAELREWLAEETRHFLDAMAEWQRKYGRSSVAAAIRYMEEHYAEQLTLAEVADHAHLSPAYFSHLFKKETGRSFVAFLIEIRMEKAKQLLSTTGLNVTEVAGIVGYDLPNYFAKLFKQFSGLTPKEYRKQQQDAAGRI